MNIEKKLNKHLRRLNKAIQRMIAQSAQFTELRKLLKEEQVELAIYVVPLIGKKQAEDELRFELTESDKHFLKESGIRF